MGMLVIGGLDRKIDTCLVVLRASTSWSLHLEI